MDISTATLTTVTPNVMPARKPRPVRKPRRPREIRNTALADQLKERGFVK